jgi:alpha/beta superfamily hydrolase
MEADMTRVTNPDDFLIHTDDGQLLRGTFQIPLSEKAVPAVLLLQGSGKLDRDSNAKRVKTDLWLPLLEALSAKGVASLRFDRRGVGSSTGTWATTGLTRNREDARAALQALREDPRVDGSAIAVLGHSEGALHASALAASEDIAATVLLAGFAGTGRAALRWQAARIAETLPWPLKMLKPLSVASMERRITKHSASTGDPRGAWWREMVAYDAQPELARIEVPVLAITGDQDFQVNPDDLTAIQSLVRGEVEARLEPGLTHILRRSLRPASLLSYPKLLRQPTDAALVSTLTEWLVSRLSVDATGA